MRMLEDRAMAACKSCGEEADELVSVKVGGKTKKVCADCAERLEAEEAVGQESEAAVQRMMDFKGRR
jgi:hypothetical protein